VNHLEPSDLPPVPYGAYSAAIDTAGGSSTGNAWSLVIIQAVRLQGEVGYRVACVREWRTLAPDLIWHEVAGVCFIYAIKTIAVDQHAASQNTVLARQAGLTAQSQPWTASNKIELFTNAATLIHLGKVELHPNKQFIRDLLSVKKRATARGYEIVLPRTADGRHADYAPAFVMALSGASAGFAEEANDLAFQLAIESNFHGSVRRC